MKLRGDPRQAFALVVGVEHSAAFADDPLVGPVRDAIDWCDALRCWGLDPAHIQMFVSPLPRSQPALDAWQASASWRAPLPATEAAWRAFINETLETCVPAQAAPLFVVWSGHGVIYQRDGQHTRRLHYADSTSKTALNLELVGLAAALRSKAFARFEQQVLVVDACATHCVASAAGRRLPEPTSFSVPPVGAVVPSQTLLLAVSPGQAALSIAGDNACESAAQFSRRLLDDITTKGGDPWPDLQAAFVRVRDELRTADEPLPVDLQLGAPDDAADAALPILPDVQATCLLRVVERIDTAVVLAAGADALRGIDIAQAKLQGDDTPAAMAAALLDSAHTPGEPAPIARWAVQIACRLDPVPPALALWIERWAAQDATLAPYRARAQQARAAASAEGRVGFVLVRESLDEQQHTVLQAWLFAGRPVRTIKLPDMPCRDGIGAAVKALLDDASDTAHRELGIETPTLIVEYALPRERLDEPLESLTFKVGAAERELGTRRPLVRRVAERLDALAARRGHGEEIVAWKATAAKLRTRFEAHGLHIAWLDAQGLRQGLLEAQLADGERASCIGLRCSGPLLAAELRDAVWADGMPFACWSQQAWGEQETTALHQALQGCKGALALHEQWQQRRGRPPLRLVWDDPERNPYRTQLRAIER